MALAISPNKSVHRVGSLPAPTFTASGASGTVGWSAVTDSHILVNYIAAVYEAAVMRAPTLDEAAGGLAALAANHATQVGFQETAVIFLDDAFATTDYGTTSTPRRTAREFVGDLYNGYFRRGADLPGLEFWTAQVIAGGDDAATREAVNDAFAALDNGGTEAEFGEKTRNLWEATAAGTMTPTTGASSVLTAVNRTTLVTVIAHDSATFVSVPLQLEGVLPIPPDLQSPVEEDDPAAFSVAADGRTRITGYLGRRRRKWSCKYGTHPTANRDGLRNFLAVHRLDTYFWLIDAASGFSAKVVLDSKRTYTPILQNSHSIEFEVIEYDDGSPLPALALPMQPVSCISDTVARLSPTAFVAAPDSSSVIDLNWTRTASDNTGVELQYRRGGAGGGWQALTTLAGSANTYTQTGLIPATAYEYRVRNIWTSAPLESGWATASAVTDTPTRAAPIDLSVQVISATGLEMEWNPVASDNTGMVLEWNSGGAWTPIYLTPGVGYYYHAGRLPETTYNYRVKNVWTTPPTDSAYSGTTGGTTPAAPPALVSASVNAGAADLITLIYDKTLDTGSVPAYTAYAVTGGVNVPAVYSGGISVAGSAVTILLDNVVEPGDVIHLTYTVPGSNKVRDTGTRNAGGFSGRLVTNNV